MPTLQKGIDPLIERLIGVYYALGIWDDGNESKMRDIIKNSVFVFCTFSYPLTLIGGGLESDELEDSIFLLTLGLTVAVLEFKGVWVFFNQNKILNLLNATCVPIPNDKEFTDRVNNKLNILRKCCFAFVSVTIFLIFAITIVSSPLVFHTLPYKIWFPLNYRKSRTAHWIAHCFVFISEIYLGLVSFLSSIMWYVMLHCSIQYDILGHRLKHLDPGCTFDGSKKVMQMEKRKSFESKMIECIQVHKQLDK